LQLGEAGYREDFIVIHVGSLACTEEVRKACRFYLFCFENVKRPDHMGDLGINGRMVLRWMWTVFFRLRIGSRGGLMYM
jgi:hypothetical protein